MKTVRDDPLKKIVSSPYLWLFGLIMIGLWLFCWAAWGGSITTTSLPANEAGLGINPTYFKEN